ncbi:hypothetical protein SeMB42_g02100 [Synchytrium endobioticum]|uniref:Uncharacterized protein n=1 Tax=Synchytrium endobioticum TaxID=286115 RepID=A0A507DHL0_9FUNG|nr:hypothetical protein SeMB42_g02100 [Synchytrium endobioticum]
MHKESCSVSSSVKTLPGQALVTTATSNRDLPEEQDVDCGHILAELTMCGDKKRDVLEGAGRSRNGASQSFAFA